MLESWPQQPQTHCTIMCTILSMLFCVFNQKKIATFAHYTWHKHTVTRGVDGILPLCSSSQRVSCSQSPAVLKIPGSCKASLPNQFCDWTREKKCGHAILWPKNDNHTDSKGATYNASIDLLWSTDWARWNMRRKPYRFTQVRPGLSHKYDPKH